MIYTCENCGKKFEGDLLHPLVWINDTHHKWCDDCIEENELEWDDDLWGLVLPSDNNSNKQSDYDFEPSNDVDREPTYEELKAYIIDDYINAIKEMYISCYEDQNVWRMNCIGSILHKYFDVRLFELEKLRNQTIEDCIKIARDIYEKTSEQDEKKYISLCEEVGRTFISKEE